MHVLLISCGPDGTVHRTIRKLTKALKERNSSQQQLQQPPPPSRPNHPNVTFAIALLGHAVGKTSAEQMSDQIFAAGRRLSKMLQSMQHAGLGAEIMDRKASLLLETQVELVPPEDAFDGWVDKVVTFGSKNGKNVS
jgi:hypothetical protein